MPKLKFSDGFQAEKIQYVYYAPTYYKEVVKPWLRGVGDDHPEARTAAGNALLIAKDYKGDWAQLERLIQGVNSAIGYSADWAFDEDVIEEQGVEKKAVEKKVTFGDDPWSQLHQGNKFACVRMINLSEVVAANGGKHGLPDIKVLGEMCNYAKKLKVGSTKGRYGEQLSAIYFHVALYNTQGGTGSSRSHLFDQLVSHKSGASVCFENSILPLPVNEDGHLLVHQTLAPCFLCRAGYRAWAIQKACTIVVAFDEPYDNSLNNGAFIFSPTGDGFEIA